MAILLSNGDQADVLKNLQFCKKQMAFTVDDTLPSKMIIDGLILRLSAPVDSEREAKIRAMVEPVDGELEVDDEAIVSEGDDNGAYVQTWTWVSFVGTDLDKEEEKDLSTCGKCGAEVPEIIGCPSGDEVCQDCFDAGAT
jgi:hypothetical protein